MINGKLPKAQKTSGRATNIGLPSQAAEDQPKPVVGMFDKNRRKLAKIVNKQRKG